MFKCSVFRKKSWNVLIVSRFPYIRPLSMALMQFWSNDLSFGPLEVIWSQTGCLSLNLDKKRWALPMPPTPCVSLAEKHQPIWKMAYLTHHVTSRDHLRSNFDVDLSRTTLICFDMWNTMVLECFPWFLCSKAMKVFFRKKKQFLPKSVFGLSWLP